MNRLLLSLLLLLTGAASGAASLAQAPLSSAPASYIRYEDYRVAAVAYRLGLAGTAICADKFPLTGLHLHQLGDYAPADRSAAIFSYSLDRGPGVVAVVEGSPAAKAGLRAGDVLLSVDGTPFPDATAAAMAKDESGERASLEKVDTLLETELRQGPAMLRFVRSGEEKLVAIEAQPGCPAKARLARSVQSNAFADGTYAIVTTKLLSFLRGDDELAIVLAHEMAHNILAHPARLRSQGVPRGLLRGFGKNAKRVWATEEEADRLSVRLLWAADYKLDAILPFWRRFYAKHDWAPQIFRTHPSLGARERIFTEAIAALPQRGS